MSHCRIVALSLILTFASSCSGTQTLYHSFHALPDKGWQKGDTLCFDVEINDSSALYDLTLEVRNRNDYPYQSLPLVILCGRPDAGLLPLADLQVTVADERGDWKGSGCGNLYQTSVAAGHIPVGTQGTYRIKVIHTSGDECLKGISDVGIKITVKDQDKTYS